MPSAMPDTRKYAPPVRPPIVTAPVIQFPVGRAGGVANAAKAKLCSECAMRKVCVPSEMSGSELLRFEDMSTPGAGSGWANISIDPARPPIRFTLFARVLSRPRL